jgi:hypothetical protein
VASKLKENKYKLDYLTIDKLKRDLMRNRKERSSPLLKISDTTSWFSRVDKNGKAKLPNNSKYPR